jgi:esterase/lipase
MEYVAGGEYGMTDIWAMVLATASAIVLIANAVEKIVKAVKVAKAPEAAQNERIAEIEGRLTKVENSITKDEKQLKSMNECNHVITKGVLALLDHGINGNNIGQMKEARNDVEAYLINH